MLEINSSRSFKNLVGSCKFLFPMAHGVSAQTSQPHRIFMLLVEGFSHYGGVSGQVGISASETQPVRQNFDSKPSLQISLSFEPTWVF